MSIEYPIKEPEPLTKDEKNSWNAFADSVRDLLGASLDGADSETVAGGFAAMKQAASTVDRGRILNTLHVPTDAGEYELALKCVLLRIPDNWGRWIRCDAGWYKLIADLDAKLVDLDPSYEVHQVKEKFAGLRFYYAASESTSLSDAEEMTQLVRAAERMSTVTCETCGVAGEICRKKAEIGWQKVLCPDHAKELDYLNATEYDKWWDIAGPAIRKEHFDDFVLETKDKHILVIGPDDDFVDEINVISVVDQSSAHNVAKTTDWDEVWITDGALGLEFAQALTARMSGFLTELAAETELVRSQAKTAGKTSYDLPSQRPVELEGKTIASNVDWETGKDQMRSLIRSLNVHVSAISGFAYKESSPFYDG